MKVGLIRERLLRRVGEILQEGSTDEVFLVSDQLKVVAGALAPLGDDEEVDLSTFTVDTTQAARMLNYHAEHVRRLIRQNTMKATKVGADYRIPLEEILTVLVRRHHDEAAPELLPSPRADAQNSAEAAQGDLELAIDVTVMRGRSRQPVRVQHFTLGLADLIHEHELKVNGESAEQTLSS